MPIDRFVPLFNGKNPFYPLFWGTNVHIQNIFLWHKPQDNLDTPLLMTECSQLNKLVERSLTTVTRNGVKIIIVWQTDGLSRTIRVPILPFWHGNLKKDTFCDTSQSSIEYLLQRRVGHSRNHVQNIPLRAATRAQHHRGAAGAARARPRELLEATHHGALLRLHTQ